MEAIIMPNNGAIMFLNTTNSIHNDPLMIMVIVFTTQLLSLMTIYRSSLYFEAAFMFKDHKFMPGYSTIMTAYGSFLFHMLTITVKCNAFTIINGSFQDQIVLFMGK
jgi:hypothetical protein